LSDIAICRDVKPYFNAGLRIVDISDPFKTKEVGYYIPHTTDKTKPRLKKVIQTNDVDLDYRGLIYITDRAGTSWNTQGPNNSSQLLPLSLSLSLR
jgi:hypothetical protein